MSYLTLTEAAAYASRVKGFTVESASLLRAGVHGLLLIAASFNGLMRNLTAHTNEEYVGLLVLAPSELLTIETEGQSRITGAFGLDGKAAYSPQVIRTLAQLRVIVSDLDKFLPSLESLDTPQATTAPAATMAEPGAAGGLADSVVGELKKPAQRFAVQEAAILDAIREPGYDPMELPKNAPGKPGVKAAIRANLVGKNPVFPKDGSQFEKAWERLRSNGEIADKS
ncbi:hypothetical protein [Rhodoferax antarcticus]|uniref:Uncharacterized protein n=1 Tax=Rhodoferax antarcticus ANT.BR TaxID=1111071 RepID=A0A1Q8YAE9_9BURK|nr:hypothetical protein [Rhodoferax antarcticus]APW47069.1 hypothetical protein RA876_12675 [Rhodoferax antarcticus]OLP04947.1 hypothetical protein BLL52_3767 [Rhodoferax antarcticus ANT.BR]